MLLWRYNQAAQGWAMRTLLVYCFREMFSTQRNRLARTMRSDQMPVYTCGSHMYAASHSRPTGIPRKKLQKMHSFSRVIQINFMPNHCADCFVVFDTGTIPLFVSPKLPSSWCNDMLMLMLHIDCIAVLCCLASQVLDVSKFCYSLARARASLCSISFQLDRLD